MITSLDQLDLNKKYTYTDYLTWQIKERVELIRGRVFKMAPAPNRKHQDVSRLLERLIDQFLKPSPCLMYHAPFDVRLIKKGDDTVVQPDICVVCDLSKLDEQGCKGAPELIIEILSPGNSKKELKSKFELYQENGVQEYWLVDPLEEMILIYRPDEEGKYVGSPPFLDEDEVHSRVLKGFSITVSQIFDF